MFRSFTLHFHQIVSLLSTTSMYFSPVFLFILLQGSKRAIDIQFNAHLFPVLIYVHCISSWDSINEYKCIRKLNCYMEKFFRTQVRDSEQVCVCVMCGVYSYEHKEKDTLPRQDTQFLMLSDVRVRMFALYPRSQNPLTLLCHQYIPKCIE